MVMVVAANSAVLLRRTVEETMVSNPHAVIAVFGNIAVLPPQAVAEEIMPTPRVVTAEAGDSEGVLHPVGVAAVVGRMEMAAEEAANLTVAAMAMAGAIESK